ncbi:MAG TPA: oxidoreductase [Rhodobiaceae bacterium]|nr:MAG: 3-oxoacyl-[acyl-carrier-protein] reductase [Rhodobiaceae bacterium UBA7378]HCQ81355.1 oxidoreductase [Rhodobiaceae bacterium]|tara:strand:+ start:327 stop:1115 length:789 start_codon:yes stop_codon:yes gene_type:complete
MDFSDQVAIVTGSSSGIGAAAAIGMARGGAKVVINYSKSSDAAEAIAAACVEAGGDAIAVAADVSDDAACRSLVEAAMDKWGRLDILVNNAGTTKFMDHANLDGLDKTDFEDIYALNTIGPYQMIRAAQPHLKACGAGSIVNISSVAGVRGVGSSIAYVASKGALNSMTLALARALGDDHIRVNAVCPGFVGTDWFRNALGEEVFDRIVEGQKNATPMHRAGTPDDVSGPILFFANRASVHVTGQLLVVDAGLLLGMPVKIG